MRAELAKRDARALVVSMLDEVAWLLNLRGSDIDFNPVFFAYAVVTADSAVLFVNPEQVNEEVREHLSGREGEGGKVEVRPYGEFFAYLEGLGRELGLSKTSVRVFGAGCALRLTHIYARGIASRARRQDQPRNR